MGIGLTRKWDYPIFVYLSILAGDASQLLYHQRFEDA